MMNYSTPVARQLRLAFATSPERAARVLFLAVTCVVTGLQSAQAQLEEITVTARRIDENLQDTPISVTAITADNLRQLNAFDVTDLRGIVSNFEILPQGGGGAGVHGRNNTSVAVRGIGTSSRALNQDLRVGSYVDEVYLSSLYNFNLSFFDIESVQVLKGPQGTLFGKNTIGGAMLVTTRKPEEEFSGYGEITTGSYSRVDFNGALNLPITDKLATRVSFHSSNVDGYIDHLLDSDKSNDINEKTLRLQAQFVPSDVFSVDLSLEHGESRDNGDDFIVTNINPNSQYVRNYNAVNAVPYQIAYAPLGLPYTVYGKPVAKFPFVPPGYAANFGNFTPYNDGESKTANLRLTWDINPNLTFKSITGYRQILLDSYRGDGTPGGLYTEFNTYDIDQQSQELQLIASFPDARVSLVTGVFYNQQDTGFVQLTGPDYVDPVGYYYAHDQDFPSSAVYAQSSFGITEKLNLTVGVRHSRDRKESLSNVWTSGCQGDFMFGYTTGGGGCWVPGPDASSPAAAERTWTHTDPRVELDYHVNPALMTYVSYTSGYQSGGFNTQNAPGIPPNSPFEQETVRAYEVGLKTEWLDGRVRFNTALFHQKYKNYQSSVQHIYNGVNVRTVTSAANAHQSGTEVEVQARLFENVTLRADFAYLDQAYDEIFPGAIGLTLETKISSAPKNQYTIGSEYALPLDNGGSFVAAVNWRWVGEKASGTPPDQTITPSYGLATLNLSYSSPGGRGQIAFWAKNLLDKYYYTSYSQGISGGIGLTTVTPGRPREVGLTLAYNFN